MFSGFMIGAYLAFWIYQIYYKDRRFNREAFKLFMFLSGAPFLVWCLYSII